MVDRQARDKMAELLRQVTSGTISMGQFVECIPKESEDPVILATAGLWNRFYALLYRRETFRRVHQNQTNGVDEQCLDCKFEGEHSLTKKQLYIIERVILFLHTDLEYEWGKKGGSTSLKWWQACLIVPAVLLVVVIWGVISEIAGPKVAVIIVVVVGALAHIIWGSERVWPFRRRSDYKAALATPAALAGKRNSA